MQYINQNQPFHFILRWEADAGMYTHKKFKKMASSVVIATESPKDSSPVITTSSVMSLPKHSARPPSPKSFSVSSSSIVSSTSIPSTLKHGVMSIIDSSPVTSADSVASVTQPIAHHHQPVTNHLPSRQVAPASFSTKVSKYLFEK